MFESHSILTWMSPTLVTLSAAMIGSQPGLMCLTSRSDCPSGIVNSPIISSSVMKSGSISVSLTDLYRRRTR